MEDIRNLHLRLLRSRLSGIAYELTHVQHAALRPTATWCPTINAYRCRDQIVICVELAGVDKSSIKLTVESQRVLICGCRPSAQPDQEENPAMQLLALEIDEGPFEREVILPLPVDAEGVRAEQRNGMLWIFLPIQESS